MTSRQRLTNLYWTILANLASGGILYLIAHLVRVVDGPIGADLAALALALSPLLVRKSLATEAEDAPLRRAVERD